MSTERRPEPQAPPAFRTLALIVPDWPALAAGLTHGLPPAAPTAVLAAGRIHTANAPARTAGIRRGMTKRAARARLPHLAIHPRDTEAEHRTFATAVTALEDLVARFTLLRPGIITVPLRALTHHTPGPDAHPGTGEAAWVEHLLTGLTERTGWEVFAGVADSTFAALLAAETSRIVPPGRTADFLADQPVDELARLEGNPGPLTDTLHALGLHTLGALAALPAAQVFERFATAGLHAWRLAAGHEDRAPVDHTRTRDHLARTHLEPPSANTDILSFAARALAADFLADIRAAGLACTQVGIGLHTSTGALQQRTWRLETMDENAIADRIRWQSQSILHDPDLQTRADQPASEDADGIATIELAAVELCAPLETQTSLFDTSTGQVAGTFERIQGLFGTDAVRTPGVQGGLDAGETNLWTPWQQTPAQGRSTTAPWPGHLPTPTPLTLEDIPVRLTDARGTPITARPDGLESTPAQLHTDTGRHTITAHSAPWPVEARWWEPAPLYHVRLQVLLDTGEALLLTCTTGTWRITGRWT